jgi:hypothetical protein
MIESALQTRVDGYTLHECRGWYKGYSENTLVIDLFGPTKSKEAEFIAEILAEVTDQALIVVVDTGDEVHYVKKPVPNTMPVN